MQKKKGGLLISALLAMLLLCACGKAPEVTPGEIFAAIDAGNDQGTLKYKIGNSFSAEFLFHDYSDATAAQFENMKNTSGLDLTKPFDMSMKQELQYKSLFTDIAEYTESHIKLTDLKSTNPWLSKILEGVNPYVVTDTTTEGYKDLRNKIEYTSVNSIWYAKSYENATRPVTNSEALTAVRRLLQRIENEAKVEHRGSKYIVDANVILTDEGLRQLTESEKTLLDRLFKQKGQNIDDFLEKWNSYFKYVDMELPVYIQLSVENVGTKKTALYRITDVTIEIIGDVVLELPADEFTKLMKNVEGVDFIPDSDVKIKISLNFSGKADLVYTKPTLEIPKYIKTDAIKLD